MENQPEVSTWKPYSRLVLLFLILRQLPKDSQWILKENGLKQVKGHTALHMSSGVFQGYKGMREVCGQLESKRDVLLVFLLQQLRVLQVDCRMWSQASSAWTPVWSLLMEMWLIGLLG